MLDWTSDTCSMLLLISNSFAVVAVVVVLDDGDNKVFNFILTFVTHVDIAETDTTLDSLRNKKNQVPTHKI